MIDLFKRLAWDVALVSGVCGICAFVLRDYLTKLVDRHFAELKERGQTDLRVRKEPGDQHSSDEKYNLSRDFGTGISAPQ